MHTSPLPRMLPRLARLALVLSLTGLLNACTAIKNANNLADQHQAMLDRQQVKEEQPAINNRQVHLDMIKTMQARSLHFASLAHIDAHETEHGSSPELQRLRADALRITGQTDAARTQYQRLLNTEEKSAARHGLGLLAAQENNQQQAILHLRESLRIDPLNANALSDLGYALLLQGDANAARIPLIQAIELAPDNRKVISNLALYLLINGEQEKADTLMQRSGVSPETRDGIAQHALTLQARHTAPASATTASTPTMSSHAGKGMQLRLQTTLAPALPPSTSRQTP